MRLDIEARRIMTEYMTMINLMDDENWKSTKNLLCNNLAEFFFQNEEQYKSFRLGLFDFMGEITKRKQKMEKERADM